MNKPEPSQIKEATQRYYDQNAIDDGRFVEAMVKHGWQCINDTFGNAGFWQHTRTERILTHPKAYDYFQLTQLTPAAI